MTLSVVGTLLLETFSFVRFILEHVFFPKASGARARLSSVSVLSRMLFSNWLRYSLSILL